MQDDYLVTPAGLITLTPDTPYQLLVPSDANSFYRLYHKAGKTLQIRYVNASNAGVPLSLNWAVVDVYQNTSPDPAGFIMRQNFAQQTVTVPGGAGTGGPSIVSLWCRYPGSFVYELDAVEVQVMELP